MKSKEEILKRNVESIAKCNVKYNVTQQGILNAMEEYAIKCQEDMAKELEELREAIRKNTWYDEDGWAQVNLYGIDNNLLNKQD